MIRLNRKKMEEKLRQVMEFINVPNEEKERIQYESIREARENS